FQYGFVKSLHFLKSCRMPKDKNRITMPKNSMPRWYLYLKMESAKRHQEERNHMIMWFFIISGCLSTQFIQNIQT
ncbi:MAG: hypothetical protein IKE36_11840, partial [Solobacterium sp.]|nr:hypothetical protein [Solobacterium sp.]